MDDEGDDDPVPLPNVNAAILKKVIAEIVLALHLHLKVQPKSIFCDTSKLLQVIIQLSINILAAQKIQWDKAAFFYWSVPVLKNIGHYCGVKNTFGNSDWIQLVYTMSD